MRLVLVGPPGAGKGTHGKKLSEKMGIPHTSTGDIFRSTMGQDTPLGLEVKGYMDRHEFVPDEVVLRVVKNRLSMPDCKKGYILDGFPRTLEQAQAFKRVDKVLYLHVPHEICVGRILGRPSGRADDTPEVITKRLEDYRDLTVPVIEHYEAVLTEIDANGTIDEVFARVVKGVASVTDQHIAHMEDHMARARVRRLLCWTVGRSPSSHPR